MSDDGGIEVARVGGEYFQAAINCHNMGEAEAEAHRRLGSAEAARAEIHRRNAELYFAEARSAAAIANAGLMAGLADAVGAVLQDAGK